MSPPLVLKLSIFGWFLTINPIIIENGLNYLEFGSDNDC